MRKYLPIKIHNVHYGKGWWWGRYLFFFHPLAIIPMWAELINTQTPSGKGITHGLDKSWDRYNEFCK